MQFNYQLFLINEVQTTYKQVPLGPRHHPGPHRHQRLCLYLGIAGYRCPDKTPTQSDVVL